MRYVNLYKEDLWFFLHYIKMSNPRARIRELERLENLEKIELLEKININKLNKIIADLVVFQIEKTVELKDYYLKNEILYYSKK